MLATYFLFALLCSGILALSMFYGKPDGERIVDRLSRFTSRTIPYIVCSSIEKVFGKSFLSQFLSLIEYVFIRRNPIVMYLYLILSVGGYILFIIHAYPHMVGAMSYHKYSAFGIVLFTLFLFLQAANANPGIITRMNHKKFLKMYHFDGKVFCAGNQCSTCKFEKPARSKHCSLCNACIGRFDHHCIWINQCIGAGNAKYFFLFLIFNNFMCLYGGYLGTRLVIDQVDRLNLRNASFRDSHTGQRYPPSNLYIFMYLLGSERVLMFLTMFCTGIGLLLLSFTWYHWITLMKYGITTNEQYKLKRLPSKSRLEFIRMHSAGSLIANIIELFFAPPCPEIDST